MNFLKDLTRKVAEIVSGNTFAKVENTMVYELSKDKLTEEKSNVKNNMKLSSIPVRVK